MTDSMSGVGNQSVNAKLIFGRELPANSSEGDASSLVGDANDFFTNNPIGIPLGTIQNRGAFSVDLPLVIMY
jgi:hypothetical protein